MKINKNVIIILAMLLYLPLIPSCHKINIFTSSDSKVNNKYYIGRANTENFQKMIEEILLEEITGVLNLIVRIPNLVLIFQIMITLKENLQAETIIMHQN